MKVRDVAKRASAARHAVFCRVIFTEECLSRCKSSQYVLPGDYSFEHVLATRSGTRRDAERVSAAVEQTTSAPEGYFVTQSGRGLLVNYKSRGKRKRLGGVKRGTSLLA